MPPQLQDALIETLLRVEPSVPRAWVHKNSLDNVLVTEIRACSDDHFLCTGRLPAAHGFFNDPGRRPHTDILFYTELGRQASLAVSHAFLNVVPDDAFIFEGSSAAVADSVWRSARSSHDSVAIDIRIQDLSRRKNNAVSRVVAEHTMWIGTQPVFHGTGAFTIQPAAVFQRLRKRSGALPVEQWNETIHERASAVPHVSGDNVTISPPRGTGNPNEFTASVIVDPRHPYFFDHACDHVPGMLLLEACAQLAVVGYREATGLKPLGVSAYAASFTQFIESGVPATLTAQINAHQTSNGIPPLSVTVTMSQMGVACGTMTILLALPAAD
jgi:hypothetical protein